MNRLRSSTAGVVWRKTPDELRVRTPFSGVEILKKICSYCEEEKYLSEFYLASSPGRTYQSQVRSQCVVCWDKHNGRKKFKEPEPTKTLDEFLNEWQQENLKEFLDKWNNENA